MHIPVITNRYSNKLVGVLLVLYVAPVSLQAPGCASKRWEWLCTGLMHVFRLAAIQCKADILQGWHSWGLQQQLINGRGSMQAFKRSDFVHIHI